MTARRYEGVITANVKRSIRAFGGSSGGVGAGNDGEDEDLMKKMQGLFGEGIEDAAHDEWKELYEAARDPSSIRSETGAKPLTDEEMYGFSGYDESSAAGPPKETQRRDLPSSEKRRMYDMYTEDPQKNNIIALCETFKVTKKAVKAILQMQHLVREAEGSGSIEPLGDEGKIQTWEEYQEWLESLDEKTRHAYRDGHFGRMKRPEDFQNREESLVEDLENGREDNWREHEGVSTESTVRRDTREQLKYPTFLPFDTEEELQNFKDQHSKTQNVMERDMPSKTIAPKLTDKMYGKSENGRYRHRTIFQDISEVSSTKDQYKIMGVLDHDGSFRPPTEEELRHRYGRMTPAKIKKASKRAMARRKINGRL